MKAALFQSGAKASRHQRRLPASGPGYLQAMRATTAVTVNRPPEEVYAFFSDLENLPTFMDHLDSVRTTGEGRSHWVAKAPAGRTVEWDAEVTEDEPARGIAWRSLEGSGVDNSGAVRFAPAPAGQGTEVRCEIRYDPPGGVVATLVAKLFGEEPSQQLKDDLRRMKQVLETGEVVVSDGSPDGARSRRQLSQRTARPAPDTVGVDT